MATTMFQRPRVEDGLSDEDSREVFPFGDSLSPRQLYFQPNSTAKSSFLSDEYSRKSLREHSAPTEGNEKVGVLERRLSLNLDPKISKEVVRFSEEKAAGLRNSKGEEWSVSLRHRLEEDLDRQVREALDTPPLIRIRRNHEKARRKLQNLWGTLSDEDEQDRLKDGDGGHDNGNHGENKDDEDKEDELSRVDMAATEIRAKARHRRKPLHIALQRFQRLQRSNYDEYPGVFGLERSIEEALAEEAEEKKEEKKALEEEKEKEASECYQPSPSLHLSPRAIRIEMFKGYTRNGFKQLLMTGGNSKHLTRIKSGIYMDRNGIIVTRDGPFWPSEHGPLLPTPRFISVSPLEPEQLMSAKDFFQHRTINDNDPSRFPRQWRGKVVVFDSERMAKGQVPHNVPEGCCPSLSFESRFESGNLRQARRIGQYEYELVLKTDLYTSRHTQWFYFRVQNALPGITYKFQIVNLLKRDSLYNYGMRPLVYSERMARDRTIGWHRSGHHISYYQFYNTSRNPLLQPDINYFCLEWQMEFPYEEDTYYLAHCYPYTYTDLKEHLDDLCNTEETGRHVRRDVLCETRAGNSCFLLTITEFPDEESKLNLRQACHRGKKGVVVSARVHPGETQASWMMKGLLDFLTGESETAKELRHNFIFKIVPMLNPDGVIVGNYRCSLAARDLNRNYRNPRKEIFPTVYCVKEMTENFKREHEIIVYCDLHGHSRKPNVFMYGCNSLQGRMGLDGAEVFINERLFPWLMAQKAPDKFAFGGCKFQIKKCKESTGRVVMWRTGIMNSFTMEATFCGTEKLGSGPPRHFNIKDFQDIGKTFCEVVLDYVKAKENKSKQSAMILDLTRHITHMILQKRDMMPANQPELNENLSDNEELSDDEEKEKEEKPSSKPSSSSDRETSKPSTKSTKPGKEKKSRAAPKAVLPPHLLESPEYKDEKGQVDVNKMIEAMSTETIEGCIRLLEQLEVTKTLSESDTSEDSDSESEPEMKDPPKRKKKKKKQKRTKSLSALPAMNNVEDKQKRNKTTDKTKKIPKTKYQDIPDLRNFQRKTSERECIYLEPVHLEIYPNSRVVCSRGHSRMSSREACAHCRKSRDHQPLKYWSHDRKPIKSPYELNCYPFKKMKKKNSKFQAPDWSGQKIDVSDWLDKRPDTRKLRMTPSSPSVLSCEEVQNLRCLGRRHLGVVLNSRHQPKEEKLSRKDQDGLPTSQEGGEDISQEDVQTSSKVSSTSGETESLGDSESGQSSSTSKKQVNIAQDAAPTVLRNSSQQNHGVYKEKKFPQSLILEGQPVASQERSTGQSKVREPPSVPPVPPNTAEMLALCPTLTTQELLGYEECLYPDSNPNTLNGKFQTQTQHWEDSATHIEASLPSEPDKKLSHDKKDSKTVLSKKTGLGSVSLSTSEPLQPSEPAKKSRADKKDEKSVVRLKEGSRPVHGSGAQSKSVGVQAANFPSSDVDAMEKRNSVSNKDESSGKKEKDSESVHWNWKEYSGYEWDATTWPESAAYEYAAQDSCAEPAACECGAAFCSGCATPPTTNVKIPKYPPFVNRYANRSNHGIPIFSQERLQERAQKSLEKQKAALRLRRYLKEQNFPSGSWTCRVEEKEKTRQDDRQPTANVYYADEDNYKRFQSWMSMSRAVQAQKQKSSQDIRNTFRLALSGQPDVFKHSYTHAGSMPPVSLQAEQLVHIGPEIRSVEPRLNQAAYPVNKPFTTEDSEFSVSSDDSENQRFKIPMADLKSPYQRDIFPQQWGEGLAARPPTHGRRAGVSPRAPADQNQVIRVRLTTRPEQRLPSVDRLGSGSSSGKDTAKDNVLSRPGRQPVVSRNIKSALSNDVLQSMAELTHSMFPRQPEGLLPARGQGSVDQTEVLLERWKLRGDNQMPTSPRKSKPPSFQPLGE
ncbi:PREDICTED: uncharacterized protein LOC109476216 [Branchiostoma belcheri]|uniref:Uncharacterized protein LOC109476216 n=1 Tax=Branchiostoma belcheri TaxID=7741 RepID=A0A6P4Z7N5_BRABE|nr:PREDICTED: uncharacterized protein LOC109476216 [Branchiostoma belcheri]